MRELQVTARCEIHDGMLDASKATATACIESVRAKDTGTLQYDWFFSDDRSLCLVRERYRDSEALLDHIDNLGELLGTLLEACDISVEIFGEPSTELVEATAGIPTKVYSFYHGL